MPRPGDQVAGVRPGSRARRVCVIGAGAAGLACAERLRALSASVSITVIDADADQPYNRPPLSKDVLSGRVDAAEARLRSDEQLAELRIDLRAGSPVERLDTRTRTVVVTKGQPVPYDDLVLAPGCAPVTPWHESAPWIRTLHSLADVRVLRDDLVLPSRVVIVGGGLIGLEAAAVLRGLGHRVVVVEAGEGPLQRIVGPQVAAWLEGRHREEGVEFELGRRVVAISGSADAGVVTLDDGRGVDGDVVVCAVGVRPATQWLVGSGVELGSSGEILADERLRTTAPGVWAAGDAVSWPSASAARRLRVEHWTCAREQGRHVAEQLLAADAARTAAFDTVPYFWSSQYGALLQGAGSFHGDEVIVDGPSTSPAGLVARYLTDGTLTGVLTVGSPRTFQELRSRLPGGPLATP
ncbi:FAD-dependent oxidoreductase [Streptomyces griseorubiginosus]|uniref:NAD(P)/FAD-dependent oxidoreductase n=1 Tax=Streptomyces griseorubiginosus TaxID=67304 RepID=UPI0036E33CD2